VATWNAPMEPGVDTADDLERVRRQLGAGPLSL
jgi:CMP-2-keto-3-deoxyoctulosonic acid synthetase